MKKLLFVALFFSMFALAAGEFEEKRSKIIGGTKAALGAWPSTVALLHVDIVKEVEAGNRKYPSGEIVPFAHANYQAQFCGANLIDANWVLTAAHCFVEDGSTKKKEKVYALIDTDSLVSGGQRKKIKQIIIHPDYDSETDDNDIALLELESRTSLPPVSVLGSDAATGSLAFAVGWGALKVSPNQLPQDLYELELPIVDRNICTAIFSQLLGADSFTNNMMCAGYVQGKKRDVCRGDSGGPLLIRVKGSYQQVGITSWGASCDQPGQYGVYTRLSKYKSWINSKVSPEDSSAGSLLFLLFPFFLLLTIRGLRINKQ